MYSGETTLYTAILIASSTIGGIILYFTLSIVRQQKRYRNLNKKTLEAEVNTIEMERKRIAADIHDEFGPVLSAAKLKISSISTVSQEDSESIRQSLAHIDHVIKMIRHISDSLTPGILSRKGLMAAIGDHLNKFVDDSKLSVTVNLDTALPNLSPGQQMHIYRIIQELIHNTLKHACARKLKIEMSMNKNDLVIRSSDNGIGLM